MWHVLTRQQYVVITHDMCMLYITKRYMQTSVHSRKLSSKYQLLADD